MMNVQNSVVSIVKKIIMALCLCVTVGYFFVTSVHRKTLLVLHSYGQDYAWVRDVNIGIKRAIGKSNYNILWHYMDTKNHPEEDFKKKSGIIARRVVDYVKPDVVLAIDDDAQNYVAKHYFNNEKIKIVFAGVNAKASQYGYDKAKNVTGILERVPYEGIKAAIQTQADLLGLKPPYKVIHISDQSIIVKYDDINLHEYKNWHPINLVPSQLAGTFDEWKKAILESKKHADFILVSNYRKVYKDAKSKEIVPFKEVIQWTFKNAPIPLIGINGFVCEEGASVSIATSPFEQGETGAKMALAILEEKVEPSDIPIQTSTYPMVFMSEERLPLSGLKFPQIYEAFARATDKFFGKVQELSKPKSDNKEQPIQQPVNNSQAVKQPITPTQVANPQQIANTATVSKPYPPVNNIQPDRPAKL